MHPARTRGYFGIGAEGVSNRPMSAPCCARRTPSARRSASRSAPASTPAPAGWPTPPTRRRTCRCGASPSRRDPPARALRAGGAGTARRGGELPSFRHPLNAAYVLGPERAGRCRPRCWRAAPRGPIPTRFALNLAVAGALVLYDRLLQHGRFADRPVMSGGARPGPPAAGAWRADLPPPPANLAQARGASLTWRAEMLIFPACRDADDRVDALKTWLALTHSYNGTHA